MYDTSNLIDSTDSDDWQCLEVGVLLVRLSDLQKLKLMLFMLSLVDDVVAKFVPLFLLRDPATK